MAKERLNIMNYDLVKSVYRIVGDEMFEKISPSTSKNKKRPATKPEIMKSVRNTIRVRKKILLSELMELSEFSRSSVQICLRDLFSKNIIKKERNKMLSGYPVTYVWVGET
tara:strand:+ start:223 stop:555 length:333 start_codon:yes stop_codon:yes gene_type:complete